MYQPTHAKFIESTPEALHEVMRAFPLGTFVALKDGEVRMEYTPFLLSERGDRLTAHFPRANPIWREIDGKPVQIAFHGPNAYISPSWYAAKRAHGKVVPTWNYIVVHAQGIARVIDDPVWLRAHLDELTETHERKLPEPWKVADAPEEYTAKLLGAIVGVEVAITALEGKFKLGQNRPEEDRRGVAQGLQAQASPLAEFAARIVTDPG